jgi:hypothetical protein
MKWLDTSMELCQILVKVIEKFEVWERPWIFYEALSTSPCLDEDASELLNIVGLLTGGRSP